jgi:hypothetical protein
MITDKYTSITTPDIEHDQANMLVEFIWLNKNLQTGSYPWVNCPSWGKTVAAIKKLMGPPFNLAAEQLAFYIWRCKPHFISPKEFAKMAVVARKLFQRYNLEEVHRLYSDLRISTRQSGLEHASYKTNRPKTLLSFLRELENGQSET